MIKIASWGNPREMSLGNNIIQLKNIVHIAIYYNYNIDAPKHPFFNTAYIKNLFKNLSSRKSKIYEYEKYS